MEFQIPHTNPKSELKTTRLKSSPSSSKARIEGFGFAAEDLKVSSPKKRIDLYRTPPSTSLDTAGAIARKLLGLSKPKNPPIIKGFDALLPRGQLLLVLGRPGSGSSTLLQALSEYAKNLSPSGSTGLNLHDLKHTALQDTLHGDVVYISNQGTQFAELSFQKELDVAVDSPGDLLSAQEARAEKTRIVDSVGLRSASDRNTLARGDTQGELKQVPITKAPTESPALQCWDKKARGVNSKTAVKLLRASIDQQVSTIALNVSHTPQPIHALIDQVTILYSGHQIFYGTMACAISYFHRLGFRRPQGWTVGDFLTALTDPDEARLFRRSGYTCVPRTAAEFAAIWRVSLERGLLLEQIRAVNKTLGGADARAVIKTVEGRASMQALPGTMGARTQFYLHLWKKLSIVLALLVSFFVLSESSLDHENGVS